MNPFDKELKRLLKLKAEGKPVSERSFKGTKEMKEDYDKYGSLKVNKIYKF